MFVLRDYQQCFLDCLLEKKSHTVGVLSTGGGKSVILAKMARHFVELGESVQIWVHRNLLVSQLTQTLSREGFEPGVIQGSTKLRYGPVQIASIQSLARRDPAKIPKPDRVIIDECHHFSATNTYAKLIDTYQPRQIYGLTATPCRSDGQGLGDLFEELVQGPSASELIDLGALCPFVMLGCASALTGIEGKKRAGDYAAEDLFNQLDSNTLNGDLARDYKRHIPGKKVIVFCLNKAHAEEVAAKYNQENISAATLLDHHSDKERTEILNLFERGSTRALVVVSIPTEGFDCPSTDAVQIAYKTISITKWLQSIGRALRPSTGKDMAYILDHSDNHRRLPWPTSNIQWSLTETPIVLEEDSVKIKDPETGLVIESAVSELDITELGTDLQIIGLEEIQALQREQQRNAILCSFDLHAETAAIRNHKPISAYYRTLEQYDHLIDLATLKEIAKRLGYHHKWAARQHQSIEEKLGF